MLSLDCCGVNRPFQKKKRSVPLTERVKMYHNYSEKQVV